VAARTGISFRVPAGAKLVLRDIKLKPAQLVSIYNGKDLTGWKVFANRKSKFTVNDKGELNIKDGPGDLQTEGRYADFVLQLDCISNGKHLNSGVFFRCRPNEYQNGYEAQIRNQFTAEPSQDYVVEEYDPATHKLVGKTKLKSAAFDYGTGAIYRRMPARKEVAKDNEWFTMTIVAHGKHLATWVNGIQVADWTDNRPPSDNARTGCRLQAGHISLQGHDPTTDLSFRNFRIAELAAMKR
jgi:3-keto-disaccharide hydrolase